ncbi:hypothetical protein IWX90DRAFT_410446 [Phyllosticta citrichinensis]|uniref:Uncharacterized protein n=1 Tax=Phyllosticta citrichinensis TaxID=1130410 RepID=A0ABR1Y659_9PEZI
MADGIDTIPRNRVIELFDAIEAVLNPFERADLRARFQEILWKHNEDQGAAKLLIDHDPYFELYDDVSTALEKMPSPGSDVDSWPPWHSARYPSDTYTEEMNYRKRKQEQHQDQQQQQQQQAPVTPHQPRPLLAPDRTIRNQNIWHSGGSGGGGSAMANVSQRSREDAQIQMANAARAWQRIDGGSSSYWNKLKTQSGVAGNTTTASNNDKKNDNNDNAADDVFGVPFDNLNLNQSSSYTPATRRPRTTSAFTPSSRSTRHTPTAAAGRNTRDTRIVKKKPQSSRLPPAASSSSSRLPPPRAAPPPMHQNLQQLSNYIKSQAAEARARAREQQREPSAQTQKTLYDLDNDVIMRELRKKQDQNQHGKRPRR